MTTATDSRPLLHRALAAIPEYDSLGQAIETLERRAAELAEAAKADAHPEELRAEVRADVVAGNPVPANVGDRLIEAEQRQRARTHELQLVGQRYGRTGSGLIGELIGQRQELPRHESAPAFDVLRAELDEILDAVHRVDAALASVVTQDEALRAGADQAAWHELLGLVDRYDALRRAQYDLTVQAMGGPQTGQQVRHLLEDAGYLANLDKIDPAWRYYQTPPPPAEPGGRPFAAQPPADWIVLRDSPWPAAKLTRDNGPWPTESPEAYLRWLVTDDPQPWLPDVDQLHQRYAEMTAPPQAPSDDGDHDRQRQDVERRAARAKRAADATATAEAEQRALAAGRD